MDGIEDKLQKLLNDPEALGAVMNMAKGLTGGASGGGDERPSVRGEENGGLSSLLNGMDPATISKVMGLVGEYTRGDDRRTKLLEALKPYVRDERRGKLDRASNLVKIARTAGAALGSFRKGDG